MNTSTTRRSGGGSHYVSARELAERWGVSEVTLWRERRAGQLPEPVRLSPGRKAWPLAQIEAIEAARRRDVAA